MNAAHVVLSSAAYCCPEFFYLISRKESLGFVSQSSGTFPSYDEWIKELFVDRLGA